METVEFVFTGGSDAGKRIPLPMTGLTFGSGSSNDVILAGEAVAVRHCDISLTATGEVLLSHRAPGKTTLVNGVSVARHVFREGDRVQIGNTEFEVGLAEEDPSEPPATKGPGAAREGPGGPTEEEDDPTVGWMGDQLASDSESALTKPEGETVATRAAPDPGGRGGRPHAPLPRGSALRDAGIESLQDYEILEVIAEGGMGVVYKARRINGDEIVALKRFKGDSHDEEAETRFEREAQVLSAFSHRNIVAYREGLSFEDEWGESVRCIVTEYLDGCTLKGLLELHPAGLPWKQAADILEQCLAGLIYAQEEHGVTHRDIKPSNIFVLKDGRVKLIDFGIARLNLGDTHTGGGALMGSYDYMSPDFVRASEKGFRGDEVSDIFSLFLCFYEMLTGKLPWPRLGGERQELEFYSRWHADVAPPPHRHPVFRVFRHLSGFVDRGLAIDREARFQNFHDILKELRALRPRVIHRKGGDDYEMCDALGVGGFGEVYKARRTSDGQAVAIKRLHANRQVRRFVKEADILAKHQHPNIVQYIDAFESVSSSGERRFYLVLEYLDGMPGMSLKDRIRNCPQGLPPEEVLRTFLNYLSALNFLHNDAEQIIHRDIKPANLYAPEGFPERAKLLDLGIARDVEGTRTLGPQPGTWYYMAPEFIKDGSRGSPQTDIYAAGLTLYEALAGKPPLPRLTGDEKAMFAECLARAKGTKVYPIDFKHPTFAACPELVRTVTRAISPDPANRFGSAAEMWAALADVLQRRFGVVAGHLANPGLGNSKSQRIAKTLRALRLVALTILAGLAVSGIGWAVWANRQEISNRTHRLWKGWINPTTTTLSTTTTTTTTTTARATTTTLPPDTARLNSLLAQFVTMVDAQFSQPISFLDYNTLVQQLQFKAAAVRGWPNSVTPEDAEWVGAQEKACRALQRFWFHVGGYGLSEAEGRRDATFLAISRGSMAQALPVMAHITPNVPTQDLVRRMFLDWRRYLTAIDPQEYLPIHQTEHFRIVSAPNKGWSENKFLTELQATDTSSLARILPHRARAHLSALDKDGLVARQCDLPMVLVPDGQLTVYDGTRRRDMTIDTPFYLSAIEMPCEALRCYRDDAARWSQMRLHFSGVLASDILEEPQMPFFRPFDSQLLDEVAEFCNWMSVRDDLPPVYQRTDEGNWLVHLSRPGYRLPSATEWEYAARFGFDDRAEVGRQPWHKMANGTIPDSLVRFGSPDRQTPRKFTSGRGIPYPLGMVDMCGNVDEICMKDPSLTALTSSPVPVHFVLKGGSAKSRTRRQIMPWNTVTREQMDDTYEFVGFRVVRPVPIERIGN